MGAAFSIAIYKFNDLVSSEDGIFSKQFNICRKLQSFFLILSSANKTVVFNDIKANYPIWKVLHSISKKPSILKALILKKPSISGVARFQMIYIIVHSMYIHVHELILLYVPGTYTFMN